ncbi:hypothetical protein BU16DRAFT_543096 [Lophium mytilinum]|uniref:Uncharacterized protein n=1 Tax=Lophium mytilinum TaxID=390894 RepID=A0A6A6QGM1_9PEZI|nr:hypothetical protein BU16DRAFT_543096 [Lophium mytilinum]
MDVWDPTISTSSIPAYMLPAAPRGTLVASEQPEQTGLVISGVHLPEELLERVAMHTASDNASAKRLRETCKLFSRVAARYVFHTVHFSPLRDNLQWLIMIASDKVLASYVRKFVYHDGSMQQFNSRRHSRADIEHAEKELWANPERETTKDFWTCTDSSKKLSDDPLVATYLSLVEALHNLQNVDSVAIYRDDRLFKTGMRSFHRNCTDTSMRSTFRCSISNLIPPHGPHLVDHRMYCDAQLNCFLHSLAPAKAANNSFPNKMSHVVFYNTSMKAEGSREVLYPTLTDNSVPASPPFKALSVLDIDLTEKTFSADELCSFDQLVSWLSCSTHLKSVRIVLHYNIEPTERLSNDDDSQGPHYGTWPRLEKLTLSGFATTARHLTRFLIRIASSLRCLSLSNLHLDDAQGWQFVLVELHNHLKLDQVHLRFLRVRGGYLLGKLDPDAPPKFRDEERRLECHWRAVEDYVLRKSTVEPHLDGKTFYATHAYCGLADCPEAPYTEYDSPS